jgi:tripartite-type tricarboxylate transporter receptor subunit TctC
METPMSFVTRTLVAGTVALIACAAWNATAQDYPLRTVRIIAGSPGTLMDVAARHVAQHLTEKLGQPVIVENRGGAGFTLGTSAAARAAADGYTLVMADRTALAFAPHLYKDLAYDAVRDFAPIALVASSHGFLVAHPSLPAANVGELIELARRQGDLNWATPGMSTGSHIWAEQFRRSAGIKLVYVHYKGSADAVRSVLSGEPKVGFVGAGGTLPLVTAGRLKLLAVTSPQRNSAVPEVPTLRELGLGERAPYWVGLLAPAGTPEAIVARLHREVLEAIRKPAFVRAMAEQGAEVAGATPAEFAERIRAEIVAAKSELALLGTNSD